LARAPRGAQPLALNPAAEPLIFVLLTRLCQELGAPMPVRIDVNSEFNASASLRRGFGSFLSRDLVLTIGLPLVAALNTTQLAAVIAHELGHFTQGFAMRLHYVGWRINCWFLRVVYERDEWDVKLMEWADDEENMAMQFLLSAARLGVWSSRLVLKGLMLLGIACGSYISRQMEYDADLHSIKLAGSRCFEETRIRTATFSFALQLAHASLRQAWQTGQGLPDQLPAFALMHDQKIPSEMRESIADRVGLDRAGIWSTHPASGDRIGRARRANQPGIFSLEVPAVELFSNFDVLAKQLTLLHYVDDLGIPKPMVNVRPTEEFFATAQPEREQEPGESEPAKWEKAFGPAKLRLKSRKPGELS
jgi:Zn-dependent protease with chaperone function